MHNNLFFPPLELAMCPVATQRKNQRLSYFYTVESIDEKYIRKIIHIDMDAFFASVAQLDYPDLQGKPVAVGGDGVRGVVAAASYEARVFGVHSAMPSITAKKRCPNLIFVKPDFKRYQEVSQQIREVFYNYTDLVEPLSLDEAFLDVTTNKKGIETATRIAKAIRNDIMNETGLTASAGISINKFMAKVASDMNKPNGQKTIMPEDVLPFLEKLPIRKFFGVGIKTAEKMHGLGIFHGKDLKQHDLVFLRRNFGKAGDHFYNIVRGIQYSRVEPNRVRKSIGAEKTFSENILNPLELEVHLRMVFERFITRVKIAGRTLTLKVKMDDFSIKTHSTTFEVPTKNPNELWLESLLLLRKNLPEKSVRLLGITLSNLGDLDTPPEKVVQLTLQF
jgi:DNA polymerase IV